MQEELGNGDVQEENLPKDCKGSRMARADGSCKLRTQRKPLGSMTLDRPTRVDR